VSGEKPFAAAFSGVKSRNAITNNSIVVGFLDSL